MLLAFTCCACVSSLHEPPSPIELAGKSRHRPEAVEGLLAAAERAYAEWTMESIDRAFAAWQAAAAADPARIEGWFGAARAAVWRTEHEADANLREAAARSAVQHAQLCAEADPDEALCDYWLAIALGVQARERPATALDALPRIVKLLRRAASAKPELDDAGPDRVLALVLARAPGWPTGPGDPDLALEHAQLADKRAPEHAPNALCLSEVLAAVDEGPASREALERARRLALLSAESGDPRAAEWLEDIAGASWNR